MEFPSEDKDKLNRVEDLKRKLFSRNYEARPERRSSFRHEISMNVSDSWQDNNEMNSPKGFLNNFFMKTSFFKKFFFFSVGFLILTLAYVGYVFFAGGNTVSNDNIEISVLGNNFTAGGEELPLIIGITNKNSSPLDLVDLVLEYPKGSDSNLSSSPERIRMSLGTIPAGAVRNENVKVSLFGEQGSIRPIKISIEYRVEGSNAIFVKEKMYEVTINSTPISLTLDAPDSVSPNQNINLNVKIALNATRPQTGMLLRLDYPPGFHFDSSSPTPSLGNNVWNLGDLSPGSIRTISISGKMLDVFDGEEKTFHIASGLQSNSDKSAIDTVFNSLSHVILIKKPFIEAQLFVNGVGGREYAINAKTPIYGEIRWSNNLDTKVNDLSIKAKISGNAFDRKKITSTGGFYDSSINTIVWDKNYQNGFAEISPGGFGSVNFSISPISLFSSDAGILQNPTINIDVSISGKQSISGYSTEILNNTDNGIVRIISDVGFATRALYYSGPFTNTGPIPPKVEKTTTYTIIWSLSNSANSIGQAMVRSTIPPWVKYVGAVSPASEDVSFNPSSREIVWNIGKIPKGIGITEGGRDVAFQISLSPSLSQVGNIVTLINDAVLTGHDDFANVDVRVSKPQLGTFLDSDTAFPPGGGIVIE